MCCSIFLHGIELVTALHIVPWCFYCWWGDYLLKATNKFLNKNQPVWHWCWCWCFRVPWPLSLSCGFMFHAWELCNLLWLWHMRLCHGVYFSPFLCCSTVDCILCCVMALFFVPRFFCILALCIMHGPVMDVCCLG